jgi:hypothetical protein
MSLPNLVQSPPSAPAVIAEAILPGRSWKTPRISAAFAPLLLVPVVLLVHGYHPFANDAGIYVAGILHILHPSLDPLNAVFVSAFTRFSIFAWTMAVLLRLTHLPLDWLLFVTYLLSIFLFLAACRQLATRLFATESARWSSVLLAAACCTLPVAGTALVLMDPWVTARSFSTPLGLMAVAASIDRAWPRAILLLLLATLIHPLMAAYTIAFLILQALVAARRSRLAIALCVCALAACGTVFAMAHGMPISAAYREAVSLPQRSFLFLARWRWYEVLGLVLPLLLLAAALRRFRSSSRRGSLCFTCVLLGTTSLVAAALFVPPAGPYLLVPLQVLRSFHLLYAIGVVLSGGLFAAWFPRSRISAVTLLVLLFAGMAAAQRLAWTGSQPIEWPGASSTNPWQQAFLWIRGHTPRDAVFTFDPRLVYLPEENEQGFRAIAERDHLADDKDAGIVAVIPRLADRWARQRNAQFSVNRMTDARRRAVLVPLGANWLLLPPDSATGFPCPYRNRVAKVCRLVR